MLGEVRTTSSQGTRQPVPSAPDEEDVEYDMNDETNGRRSRQRRVLILAAALAGTTLLAAACGHSVRPSGAANGQPGGASTYQQAVAFSKCMRSHGDPAWPDPGPEGAFANDNGSLDKSSPQFKKAAAACKKLEPGGPPASAFQQGYRQLLKYSACVRAHGMPNFPDPILEDHGVGIKGNIDENSPRFKAANQACKSLMPGAGGSS
jgi:hypothetical protein